MADDKNSDNPAQVVGAKSGSVAAEKRAVGRPMKGKPFMVRMSEDERAVADRLGAGNLAEGIRIAMHALRYIDSRDIADLTYGRAAVVRTASDAPPRPGSTRAKAKVPAQDSLQPSHPDYDYRG